MNKAIVSCAAISASIWVATSQGATPVNCTAIEQVFFSDARSPQYFYLDLPKDASFVSGAFQARPGGGGPWETCGPAGKAKLPTVLGASPKKADATAWQRFKRPCDDLFVTEPVLPLPSGPDPDDGTTHYSYQFNGITSGGIWGEVYLRMVLNYTMKGPSCLVQHSYFAAKGTGNLQLPIDLHVPAGKVITHERTFGRIDPPGPKGPPTPNHWIACGADKDNFPNGVSEYQGCSATDAMGLNTQAVANDAVDGAPGRASACGASGWGGYALCRVQLEYNP